MPRLKTLIRNLFIFQLALALQGSHLLFAAEPTPNLEDYRRHALTREGEVARGKSLFNDEQRLACAKCHSVDGSASKAGPDLFAAGDAFGRRDLIEAVLQPSAIISPGYGTVIVETKAGESHQGILKQATPTELQLMGADGKAITIPLNEIKERTGSSLSLMPEGLQAGLTQQEFTDLVEYLTTLRQPEAALASHHGFPAVIEKLEKPVSVRPFLTNTFTLPRGKVTTGLTSFRQLPGATNTFLVLHQKGVIWKVIKSAAGEEKSVFVDLTKDVFSDRGPNGLLDIAFHPKFRENRKYYLFYQVFEDGKVATYIDERQFDAAFSGDSGQPARHIIHFVSVAEDHSGGCLEFGPDGYLYIVMGDTGPHHDPNGHAQNLQLLLGKLLRIDVDRADVGLAYSIPKDNPFVGRANVRPEIWAYGLRNPWRFSFDRLTGELWMADVGQDREEEVAIIRRGENHGWNVYEGFEAFSKQYRREGEHYIAPIFAYRRKYGNSITGGFVYRGDKSSSFYGAYICGDFTSKLLFALTQENGSLKTVRQIGTVPQGLVSISEDAAGNIYAVGFEGAIYQLDFSAARFE